MIVLVITGSFPGANYEEEVSLMRQRNRKRSVRRLKNTEWVLPVLMTSSLFLLTCDVLVIVKSLEKLKVEPLILFG